MKIHSSYAHNTDLSEIADNQQSFRKMADVLSEKNLQADEVHISDEGMQAWKNHVQSMNPQVESSEEYIMTVANTNEVEFEHYSKMMDMSGDLYEKIRKDEHREVNLNDIMKSMMDTYDTLYNDIVKAHENGDREVKVTDPHFKWGFDFSPSRAYYWFRQRRGSAAPLLLVALHCRACYFLPSSNLSFSSCS